MIHIYIALLLTLFNVSWDWAFDRLGPETIAWEGGILATVFAYWLYGNIMK